MRRIAISLGVLLTAVFLFGCTADKDDPNKKPAIEIESGSENDTGTAVQKGEPLAEVMDGAIDIDLDAFFPDREIRNLVKNMINKEAPNFVLNNMNGEKVELDSFVGEPFILEFAWTGCPACQAAQPNIVAFEESNKDIPVIQVFANDTKEQVEQFIEGTAASVAPFGESNKAKMLHGEQSKSINELYNVQFTPTFYFVDSEGVIRFLTVGVLTDVELKSLADLAFSKDPSYQQQ